MTENALKNRSMCVSGGAGFLVRHVHQQLPPRGACECLLSTIEQ